MDLGHQDDEPDREGQWRRRRRLDGALNRLPPDFYILVWHILERVGYRYVSAHILHVFCSVREYKLKIIICLLIQLYKK